MRETGRAAKAFDDYAKLGDGRSLEKLLNAYRNDPAAPTRQIATLKRWSTRFGWQARLVEMVEAERAALVRQGIVVRQNRLDAYNERWQALRDAVRAWAEEHKGAPGGAKSGYYLRRVSVVKVMGEFEIDHRGRSHFVPTGQQVEVEEWELDGTLLKELRDTPRNKEI